MNIGCFSTLTSGIISLYIADALVVPTALLATKSFPNVVSLTDILPLSPFSTSSKPKSAKPLESLAYLAKDLL